MQRGTTRSPYLLILAPVFLFLFFILLQYIASGELAKVSCDFSTGIHFDFSLLRYDIHGFK